MKRGKTIRKVLARINVTGDDREREMMLRNTYAERYRDANRDEDQDLIQNRKSGI